MSAFDLYKTLSITLFAYLCLRFINSENKQPYMKKFIGFFIYVILTALVLAFSSPYVIEPLKTILVITILSVLTAKPKKISLKYNFTCWGISYAVSSAMYLVSAFLSSVISVMIFDIAELSIVNMAMTLVFETVFMLVVYKMKFKIILNVVSIGTAISGAIIFIYGALYESRPTNYGAIYLIFGVVLCGLGLYWWLKKESITAFNDMVQGLKATQQEAKIAELTDNNLELEKTIHTDSKKLPAYREAVVQTIATGDKQAKIALYEGLKTAQMAMVMDYMPQLPTVGILLVDIVLNFNKQRCSRNGIDLRMEKSGCFGEIVECVPQSQLETIIVNLLDNAFKSHGKRGDDGEKYIVVRFSHDRITVEDNGAAFTDSVLADMERCKESLTPNRGEGVGLGYVTMFEITNECGASVEVSQKDGVKSVTVRLSV